MSDVKEFADCEDCGRPLSPSLRRRERKEQAEWEDVREWNRLDRIRREKFATVSVHLRR